MGESTVHYTNEPFMAHVDGMGDEAVECTPLVYDSFSNCGVAIRYPDGTGQVWGLVTPRNLITAWRGTEILRRLDRIENGTLSHSYETGKRNPHVSDMERVINPMIERIGRAAYDEIMTAPVPEEIIRAILDNQENEDVPAPGLWPIADEVRAGTIEWRQEFADAGIEHPDEADAKKKAEAELVSSFDHLLDSVAAARGLTRDSLGMGHIEGALLAACEKGLREELGDEMLVALASAVGAIGSSAFTLMMMPFNDGSGDKHMQSARVDGALAAADWVVSLHQAPPVPQQPRQRRWSLRRQPEVVAPSTQEDSPNRQQIFVKLLELIDEHFPISEEDDADSEVDAEQADV